MAFICPITEEYISSWTPLVSLAVLLGWFGISLYYMISKFLAKPYWEARAKTEFGRMFFTTLIAVSIFIFSEMTCSVVGSLVNGDPFVIAKTHMQNLYNTRLVPATIDLWQGALDARKLANFMDSLAQCYFGACYFPYAGFSFLASDYESVSTILASFGASLMAQYFFLDFVKLFAFSFLLPAGIIIKSIPMMRDAGSLIISIAMAFYFVFPLIYVIDYIAYTKIMPDIITEVESMTVDKMDFSAPESLRLGSAVQPGIENSFRSIVRTAAIFPSVAFTPVLALLITIACARAFYSVISKDMIEEVFG